jgi:hypothetical protein
MAKAKSGGDLGMNKVVHRQAPKVEPKPHAINPGGAGQLGSAALAPKYATPLEAGRGYSTPVGPSSNMGQGPGANRQVHHCGSQGQHGSPNRGEAGIVGSADRGNRAILGPPKGK